MDFWKYCASNVIFCWIREEGCENIAVDIHHIDGRTGSKRNDIFNLISTCRNCHNKAHANKVKKEVLFEIVKKRIEQYEKKT